MRKFQWFNPKIYLLISIFAVLFFANETFNFNIVYLVLFAIISAKPRNLIASIISISIATNVYYYLNESSRNLASLDAHYIFGNIVKATLIFMISISLFNWRNNEYNLTFIRLEKNTVGIINILIVWLLQEFRPNWLINILRIGYDNISHLAMINALHACQTFITACSQTNVQIPSNFIRYPQQWHLIFSNFIDDNDLNRTTYFIFVLITFFASVKLILDALIKSNKFQKNVNSLVSVLVISLIITLASALSLMGYHNFLLASSIIIWSQVSIGNKGRVQNFILTVLGLLIATAMYTLFWPLTSILILNMIFNIPRSGFKSSLLLVFASLATISVFLPIIYNQIAYRQFTALSENTNGWIAVFPIVFCIGYLILDSTKNWFLEHQMFFLKSQMGIAVIFQLVIFLSGQVSSYFLYKYFLFQMISSIVCLNQKVFFQRLRVKQYFVINKLIDTNLALKIIKTSKINEIAWIIFVVLGINLSVTKFIPFYFPGPLQVVRNLENNQFDYLEKIIYENKLAYKPIFVVTPFFGYYSDSQYVASTIGLWPDKLQKELDRLASSGIVSIGSEEIDLLRVKGFQVIFVPS